VQFNNSFQRVSAVLVTTGDNIEFLTNALNSLLQGTQLPSSVFVVHLDKVTDGDETPKVKKITDAAKKALVENEVQVDITYVRDLHSQDFSSAVTSLMNSNAFGNSKWVWLLHDDVIVEPETFENLILAATRFENIAVAGLKQVDTDTKTLLNVGYTSTLFGTRISTVEDEEYDQGQYKNKEDTFAVSLNGALVLTDTWMSLEGANTGLFKYYDSLDFCRRVHISGKRVVVADGPGIYHYRRSWRNSKEQDNVSSTNSFVPNSYNIHRALTIYRLGICPLIFLPFVPILLLVGAFLKVLRELYVGNRHVHTILYGSVVGIFSFRSIFESRRLNAVAKREGRRNGITGNFTSRISPLLVSKQQLRVMRHDRNLMRRSKLWAAHQPSLLQVSALRSLAKKRRMAFILVLIILAVITIAAFADDIGIILSGGHFVASNFSVPDLTPHDAWTRATSGYTLHNFGIQAPLDSYWFIVSILSFVLGSVKLTVNLMILLVILLSGLSAWIASGAASRSNSARMVATITWVLLPTFWNALSSGHFGVLFAHAILPLVLYYISKATAIARTDLDLGAPKLRCYYARLGLVMALAICFEPVLFPVFFVVIIILGVYNRRFFITLLPIFALNIWLFSWVILNIKEGSLKVFLGDARESQHKNALLVLLGGTQISLSLIISAAIILISSWCLFVVSNNSKVLFTRIMWAVSLLTYFLSVIYEDAVSYDSSALLSITYLGFLTTILVFLKERVVFKVVHIIPYLLVILVLIVTTFAASNMLLTDTDAQKLRAVPDYTLPLYANKIVQESKKERVLVLNSLGSDRVNIELFDSRSSTLSSSNAANILEEGGFSSKDTELQKAVANLLALSQNSSADKLEEMGIGGVFVPKFSDDDINLIEQLDSAPGLVRIIEGSEHPFWKLKNVSDDTSTTPFDNTEYQVATTSVLNTVFIFVALTVLVIFCLLSLPLGQRSVVIYEI
jgi:GT2 family glycosyltransferase